MEVNFRRIFLKQLANIPSTHRQNVEDFVFKELPQLNSISESGKIEKMRGYRGFYKVRFGQYRVGIEIKADKSILVRAVMHRREIYRFFP